MKRLAPVLLHRPTSPPASRLVRSALVLGAATAAGLAHGQAIYMANEQAWAGGSVCVRGDALDSNAQFTVYPYSSGGVRQAGIQVSPLSSNGQAAMINLPSSLNKAVYEIAASTVKGGTNSVFINKPRLEWSDVTQAQPGQSVRVIGRNLAPVATVAPIVTLTNNVTKAAYTATNVRVSDNCVTFGVPASAAVGSYTVSVNNGLSGTASDSSTTLPLGVVARTGDPFGLGVSWAGGFVPVAANVWNVKTDPRLGTNHAVGDGVTDDTQAIRSALIIAAQQGGGTVYLPAGTYRCDDGAYPAYVSGGTVLAGDGKGRTVLQVGYRYSASNLPNGYCPIGLNGRDASYAGIYNLTIENVNSTSTPSGVLGMGPYWMTTPNSFLKNVEVRINNGTYVTFAHPRQFVVSDCDFKSTALTANAIGIVDAEGMQFLRNTVTYRAGRTAMLYDHRCVFEGNTIAFDNAYRTPTSVEIGGFEGTYSQQILVQDNAIQATNGQPTKQDVDGELIMTQLPFATDFNFVGMVRTATSRILVPSDTWAMTNWLNSTASTLPRIFVAIISGKGTGQWRWVSSYSRNSLMVDRPWQVIPDATSRYSISPMSCFEHTYQNNQLSGSCTGIQLWDGAVDTMVVRNTLTNTGSINLRTDAQNYATTNPGWAAQGPNVLFDICWDTSVVGNTVVNSNGFRPASIAVASIDEARGAYGTMVLGVDVRNNAIAGSYTTSPTSYINFVDGLEIYDDCHTATDSLANVGTIVQNNTVTGSAGPMAVIGTTLLIGNAGNVAIATAL